MLPLVHAFNKWEFHILVVLSFTLQVFLLLFGGIRRRNTSAAARIFLWLVYLLADSTATYTLGLMASSSQNSGLQPLVVFWAPFLLLHLGGQDTVSAYALEDNELWSRHLFSLAVQAFGAAYILYKYIAAGDRLLLHASILVSVVGLVKYGERIWALKCASMSSMQVPFILSKEVIPELKEWATKPYGGSSYAEYRRITGTAHSVLHICKRLFVTPSNSLEWCRPRDYLIRGLAPNSILPSGFIVGRTYRGPWAELKRVYRTVDLKLSLMYDLLYTKSAVIHTWYGYIIRALSFLAIVYALVLFIRSSPSSYSSRGDVAVTYVLMVGACVLEMASIVRVMGSTWTYSCFRVWAGRTEDPTDYHIMNRFAGTALSLRWNLRVRLRSWFSSHCHCNLTSSSSSSSEDLYLWPSTCIGQYNIISTATTCPCTDIRWRIARLIGQDDLWMNAHHSTFIQAPPAVVRAIYTEITRRAELTATEAHNLDNKICLGRWTARSYEKLESLCPKIHSGGLIAFILGCHIATDIFVHCCDQNDMSQTAGDLPQVALVLSNYVMYLLRVHRDILLSVTTETTTSTTESTDIWDKKLYDKTFNEILPATIHSMKKRGQEGEHKPPQDILLALAQETSAHGSGIWRLTKLAARLLETTDINLQQKFQFLADLWVDTLLYVTDGIPANFHAKQLSYGGEFVTVVSVLMANVGLLKQELGTYNLTTHTGKDGKLYVATDAKREAAPRR